MDRRCSRKAMLEEQGDGEARLVFWQLRQMDISRSKMLVQLNSKFQKFPLYSYLVRINHFAFFYAFIIGDTVIYIA